jgi:hypothetical protein
MELDYYRTGSIIYGDILTFCVYCFDADGTDTGLDSWNLDFESDGDLFLLEDCLADGLRDCLGVLTSSIYECLFETFLKPSIRETSFLGELIYGVLKWDVDSFGAGNLEILLPVPFLGDLTGYVFAKSFEFWGDWPSSTDAFYLGDLMPFEMDRFFFLSGDGKLKLEIDILTFEVTGDYSGFGSSSTSDLSLLDGLH